ncbi:AAA family ATPase [Clostridium botulinum C]|uniref:endopeptidase La n=2 Tax=Clostridium botulinum TaxID=1491 RepID=A0A9Q4XXA2_CLOBO|nr:AAA family ATPase [Clostridium botulinum]MCD3194130.1 AAA family ATPase [Clostridium botulinum C]MCD3199241.1 AAA family ATPase [Clostridium botulinum C]MCD3204716.1 AAA family ATPase [Clostridium botulinum C]MCD3208059.1 AAA family ATPase [Clostridium botulinum C]MCD3225001.1 AAA family ATPase [Clostridium botulinum C]
MELSSHDVIYKFDFHGIQPKEEKFNIAEYKRDVYKKLKTALEIDKEGYNIFLIDDFSKMKLKNIKEYIKEAYKDRSKPKDICYVIKEDAERPYPLYISGGKGYLLKDTVRGLQKKYLNVIYNFYNGVAIKEKEEILDDIQGKRSKLVNELMKSAEDKGFKIKSNDNGFTFVPIKEDEIMTEVQYEELDDNDKKDILSKVTELKLQSTEILDKLKDIEIEGIDKIKVIIIKYFKDELNEIKEKYKNEFSEDLEAINFLNEMCEEIEKDSIENYSMIYEDDEEKILEIIMRYDVNIIVDNTTNDIPEVIYEDDPNVIKLLGSIDYKNQNGTYVTDVSFIKGGSLLRANEGCIIMKASNLLANPTAYYNLKKVISSGELDFNYNKGYVDLISISGLDPKPIKVNAKVILVGDYETYDILYNYDKDFSKLFKIKAQYNPIISIKADEKEAFIHDLNKVCINNNLKSLNKSAIVEIAKFASRKAEDKNKLFVNNEDISEILVLSNNNAKKEDRDEIIADDVLKCINNEDIIEEEVMEYYKDNTILLDVTGRKVGQINGLSVIDFGYFILGKPIRITCSCYKGDGEIIDVEKQSELSGNIHNKAVNILKGCISSILGKYAKIPVDFHLSFEQVYSRIDGDSASVAEFISMISSLSNMPIRQNIAVTGSLNQFGEVQPIGGVNEKIEGFYKVCKVMDNIKNKGVLIPFSNKNNLVLNNEVEKAIDYGSFHIYVMKNIKDAIEILIGDYNEVMSSVKREIRKYNRKA